MVELGIRSHPHSKSAARCSTQALKVRGFFPVTLFTVSVSMTALPSRTSRSDCATPFCHRRQYAHLRSHSLDSRLYGNIDAVNFLLENICEDGYLLRNAEKLTSCHFKHI